VFLLREGGGERLVMVVVMKVVVVVVVVVVVEVVVVVVVVAATAAIMGLLLPFSTSDYHWCKLGVKSDPAGHITFAGTTFYWVECTLEDMSTCCCH